MNIAAMNIAHIHQLIPDYVLGLLSADDSRRVEQHARQCPLCREAIQRERLVEFRVRGAVQLAARPPAGRLEALRPPLPSPSGRGLLPSPFGRGLGRGIPAMALVMLLVVVLLAQVGGYGLPTPGFGRAIKTPTTLAATASTTATTTPTATQTPTATLAATDIASATLTHVNWSSEPPPAPEPAPHLSNDTPSGPIGRSAKATATPIITLTR